MSISLAGGGAERSTALLSKMLDAQGYDITIALVNGAIDYQYSGTVYNIGMGQKPFGFLSTIGNLLRFSSFIKKQQFDLIIDNRTRPTTLKESIYSGFLYKGVKVLYVVRSYHLPNYFPKSLKMVKKQASRALGYVGVSKAITENITTTYGIEKVFSIYNPIQIKTFNERSLEYNVDGRFILAVGRLDEDVKNFSLLLEAYAQSDLPKNNIALKILGDGPDKHRIQAKLEGLQLQDLATIEPFTKNPFPYYKQALCTTLTSQYEGFPRALLESLAVGTPVVSVDCLSGPAEIVNHGDNGLLVVNHDSAAFASALNNLIFDTALYAKCKAQAQASVAHLDAAEIAQEWDQLVQKLL
ncbi:MAG: glycosyltransferase [Gilvibacter sp.]